MAEQVRVNSATTYRRYTALDGLRGLAALVVVVHHALLVSPWLGYETPPADPPGWASALLYTPLHFVWAGTEAVYVFFVLSGFVLTLPFVGAHRVTWRGYYPRRLVRLYLPVWASLAFAVLTYALVERVTDPNYSWWVNAHDVAPSSAVRDLALVFPMSLVNSPLWSLRWEVIFSLLLPLYIMVALRLRRLWLAGIVGVIAVTGIGAEIGRPILTYLPIFAAGVLMAANRERLAEWSSRIPRAGWALLDVAAVLLLVGAWMLPDLPGRMALPAAGAVLTVFLFLGQPGALRLGDWGPVSWLGRRSFSLYLIHEPIVVSVALALSTTNPLFVLVVALPLSLLIAALFFRFMEGPSHRLANKTGRVFGDRRERVVPTPGVLN